MKPKETLPTLGPKRHSWQEQLKKTVFVDQKSMSANNLFDFPQFTLNDNRIERLRCQRKDENKRKMDQQDENKKEILPVLKKSKSFNEAKELENESFLEKMGYSPKMDEQKTFEALGNLSFLLIQILKF